MSQPAILITGANGQVGQELRVWAAAYPSYEFIFTTREEMPVDDEAAVQRYFAQYHPVWCINCAAYTAVDKAETEQAAAFRINAEGPRILAAAQPGWRAGAASACAGRTACTAAVRFRSAGGITGHS